MSDSTLDRRHDVVRYAGREVAKLPFLGADQPLRRGPVTDLP